MVCSDNQGRAIRSWQKLAGTSFSMKGWFVLAEETMTCLRIRPTNPCQIPVLRLNWQELELPCCGILLMLPPKMACFCPLKA